MWVYRWFFGFLVFWFSGSWLETDPFSRKLKEINGILKENNGILKELNGILKEINGILKKINGILKEINGILKEINGILKEILVQKTNIPIQLRFWFFGFCEFAGNILVFWFFGFLVFGKLA